MAFPDFNTKELCKELGERGAAWADMHAAAELLEEAKKSILAMAFLAQPDGSVAAREYQAMASQEYRDHLDRMVKARLAANRARVRYDTFKAFIELSRTEAANERAAARVAI